ncbi:MAG: YkvA family protein [Gammaproteobacteria bacterium]
MSLKVTFDLADADLEHFRLIMREARDVAKDKPRDEILASAEALLVEVRGAQVPDFVSIRLERIQLLVDMLRDEEWKLPAEESTRVLNALAYFSEPEDLIPDHVPGLGFLDDAIMVELVNRELRHEIEAYRDFCDYRTAEESRRSQLGKPIDEVTKEEFLASRRAALHARIRNRRSRERQRRRRSGGRSPFSLLP